VSKEQIAGTYDLVATTFDRVGPRFFSYSGRSLVELAQVPSGACVLDVATGRGAALLPASERVGQYGRVIGVDRSVGMVREVAKDVRREGLRQVKICQMDADRLGFADGSFGFVLCGHAIYYFPQAMREFHRILLPGGQVALTTVAKGCLDWIFEILDRYLHEEGSEEDEREDGESLAINTAGGLKALLGGAGFEGIRVVMEETDFVYIDEEEWWSALRTMGVRWSLEKMDAGDVANVKAAMFDYLQAFKRPDGVHVLYRVWYALGSKAVK